MSQTDSTLCPRCDVALKRGAHGEIEVLVCDSCKGVLVRQRDLTRLLQLVAQATEEIDDGRPLEPVPDKGAGIGCPQCGQRMENYGYMESNLVKIDGCIGCSVVWLDTDELGKASVMHARSQRSGRVWHSSSNPDRTAADASTDTLLARAAGDWVAARLL